MNIVEVNGFERQFVLYAGVTFENFRFYYIDSDFYESIDNYQDGRMIGILKYNLGDHSYEIIRFEKKVWYYSMVSNSTSIFYGYLIYVDGEPLFTVHRYDCTHNLFEQIQIVSLTEYVAGSIGYLRLTSIELYGISDEFLIMSIPNYTEIEFLLLVDIKCQKVYNITRLLRDNNGLRSLNALDVLHEGEKVYLVFSSNPSWKENERMKYNRMVVKNMVCVEFREIYALLMGEQKFDICNYLSYEFEEQTKVVSYEKRSDHFTFLVNSSHDRPIMLKLFPAHKEIIEINLSRNYDGIRDDGLFTIEATENCNVVYDMSNPNDPREIFRTQSPTDILFCKENYIMYLDYSKSRISIEDVRLNQKVYDVERGLAITYDYISSLDVLLVFV